MAEKGGSKRKEKTFRPLTSSRVVKLVGLVILTNVLIFSVFSIITYDEKNVNAYNMKTSNINKLKNNTYVKIFGTIVSSEKQVLIVTNPGSRNTKWEINEFNLSDNTDSIQIIIEQKDSIHMGYHNYNRDYWSGDKVCIVGWVRISNQSKYINADIIAHSPTEFPPQIYPYLIIGAVIGSCILIGGFILTRREKKKNKFESSKR